MSLNSSVTCGSTVSIQACSVSLALMGAVDELPSDRQPPPLPYAPSSWQHCSSRCVTQGGATRGRLGGLVPGLGLTPWWRASWPRRSRGGRRGGSLAARAPSTRAACRRGSPPGSCGRAAGSRSGRTGRRTAPRGCRSSHVTRSAALLPRPRASMAAPWSPSRTPGGPAARCSGCAGSAAWLLAALAPHPSLGEGPHSAADSLAHHPCGATGTGRPQARAWHPGNPRRGGEGGRQG